ncbi:hypothetical protein KEM56_002996 [Ascosphaera pollenicola]|nr:hypothetical protein KEM56_002996 [Ascosphaera pollenicola]
MAERTSTQSRGRAHGRMENIDSLESVGFVSRGDTKLLDPDAQEAYYKQLVHRYMRFCSVNSKDLDGAFLSLPKNRSDDPTKNPPVAMLPPQQRTRSISKSHLHHHHKFESFKSHHSGSTSSAEIRYSASKELSILLLSLRKLREAILATGPKTSVAFARRVSNFCIRTGLLARHPPSYYPPLERLIRQLETRPGYLELSEVKEFVTYMILDYACRQDNLEAAFALRARSKEEFGYQDSIVDNILKALTQGNWILFWKTRNQADGYSKALIYWAVDGVRRRALKAVGRSYLQVPVEYIVETCAGEKGSWEELAEKEQLGWRREGDKILIKVKRKPTAAPAAP